MKTKRILSVLLVIVMLAAVFSIDQATAAVGPFSGHMNSYIWSRDYSQVTAVDIYYHGNTDDQPSSSAYRESVSKSETVNTVVSSDGDGFVTYTATFSDSDFTAQSRRIYDADDVVKKWDFEAAADVNDWTLSGFVRSNGNEYYRERIGRSGEYYLLANDENNLAPEICTCVTLPENACLTFWVGGGVELTYVNDPITVYCGKDVDSMEEVWSGSISYQADGEHYNNFYCLEHLGIDPKQFFVDLSAYSGKRVYLKIALTIPKHTYYDPPYNLRYPYTILIDDVEIRDGSWRPLMNVPADSDHFPDPSFCNYVSNTFDSDSDGILSLAERNAENSIDVSNMGIASLQGIEHFPNLNTLICYNNQITALDLSKNTALTYLDCDNNQLTALDLSKNTALRTLWCCNNELTALDVSNNTALKSLNCKENQLKALDVSNNPALVRLDCASNRLSALVITQNPQLTTLFCYGNTIPLLSISENPSLLDAYQNGEQKKYTQYFAYELSEENTYLYVDADTVVSTSPIAAPVITTQPSAKTVAAGAKATFKVVASGTGLTYQWQYSRNGTSWTDKAGATSASYTVTAKASYNGLYYRCKVSNAGGEVFSNKVKLTVTSTPKPVITTQPANKTVAAGASATFQVAASGTGLTYQWQYKTSGSSTWHDKSGATSASYTTTANTKYNGIQYRCVVSNAGGSVTSAAATLTVTVAKPVITTQPKAQTAAAGETATFKVVAAGTGLTYQWQYSSDYGKTWHNKAGSTKATHKVTVKASYNGYLYRCKVTNSAGTVTSSKVRLTVSGVKPKILSQPAAVSAAAGESVTFKVAAAGVGMSYQWQYKTAGSSTWKDKSGATSASYTVTAKESYNGIQYRCVVTNSVGSVTSDPAVLTVS